jgi:hypothetical protein
MRLDLVKRCLSGTIPSIGAIPVPIIRQLTSIPTRDTPMRHLMQRTSLKIFSKINSGWMTRFVKRFSRTTAEYGTLRDTKHTVKNMNYFVTELRIDHTSARLSDPVYKLIGDRCVIEQVVPQKLTKLDDIALCRGVGGRQTDNIARRYMPHCGMEHHDGLRTLQPHCIDFMIHDDSNYNQELPTAAN